MIIKRSLYKIAIAIAIILMLISTASASRHGNSNVIFKTDPTTSMVDLLKFPVCGCGDEDSWDNSCNDRDKSHKCKECQTCPSVCPDGQACRPPCPTCPSVCPAGQACRGPCPPCPTAKLDLNKTTNTASYLGANKLINYTYNVTNTGDVSLTNVYVIDDKTGIIVATVSSLDPGQSVILNSQYTTVGADEGVGKVVTNDAVAIGTVSDSILVASPKRSTTVPFVPG